MRAYHRFPMGTRAARILIALLAVAIGAGPALGQSQERRHDPRAKQRNMKEEDRRRMRDDMRDAYRERQGRPDRPRQMSPQERDKLRSDLEEANRQLRRK